MRHGRTCRPQRNYDPRIGYRSAPQGPSLSGLGERGNGAVVINEGGKAFEVEFVTLAGDTLGMLTLTADEVRPISARDVPHVGVA